MEIVWLVYNSAGEMQLNCAQTVEDTASALSISMIGGIGVIIFFFITRNS